MNRRVVWAFIVPIAVIAFVVGGIVAIGSLLLVSRELTHNALAPVAVALALTLLVSIVATIMVVSGKRTTGAH